MKILRNYHTKKNNSSGIVMYSTNITPESTNITPEKEHINSRTAALRSPPPTALKLMVYYAFVNGNGESGAKLSHVLQREEKRKENTRSKMRKKERKP